MVIHWTVNPAPLARLVRSQYNPPNSSRWYNGITSVSKTADRGSIPWRGAISVISSCMNKLEHRTHIFVIFLPGAGGNFLARCLNFLDGAVCFVPSIEKTIPRTFEEKQKILHYKRVYGLKFHERNWVMEEQMLIPYSLVHRVPYIPWARYDIRIAHPDNTNWWQTFMSSGNNNLLLYIDPTGLFDWCLLNALYKNSYWSDDNISNHPRFKNNNEFYKVSLKNIIANEESFMSEFQKICEQLKHTLSLHEETAIRELYRDWITTTLAEKDFENFKETLLGSSIG